MSGQTRNAADLVLAHARSIPERVALSGDGVETSFADLASMVGDIETRLRISGVRVGHAIGVHLDRSADLVAAILAIWRIGAIYVPLDPSYPQARLVACAEDAGICILVTARRIAAKQFTCPTLILDAAENDPTAAAPPLDYPDAATIIFTSGTTGRPKGVVGSHPALLASLEAQLAARPFAGDEAGCFKAPIGFIDALAEAFLPLAAGCRLALASAATVSDPHLFFEFVDREHVTRLMLVSSLARALSATPGFGSSCRGLRELILNSEPVDRTLVAHLARLLPRCRLVHGYGTTETCSDVSFIEIATCPNVGEIVVGPPLDGATLHILDEGGAPIRAGEIGEMHVGGTTLALAYHNAPDLTAARFIEDGNGARLYRTGDLAVLLPDGRAKLLGRRDRQVKVGGMRVELDEVDAALRAMPAVADAAVVALPAPGGTRLVAFIVPRSGSDFDPGTVRAETGRRLPKAMLPLIHILPRLPLSANGKTDIGALRDLALGGPAPSAGSTRLRLETIVTDVLGLHRAASDKTFFELGGDSLSAMAAAARIEHTFGVRLPIGELLQDTTLAIMAERIDGLARGRADVVPSPLSSGIDPRPLTDLQRMFWRRDRVVLASDTDTLALVAMIEGALDAELVARALDHVVQRHPMLRSRFTEIDGCIVQSFDASRPALARVSGSVETLPQLVAAPFDLTVGPPIRATLVAIAPDRHALVVLLHHLVADDRALRLVARDLASAYRALREGSPAARPMAPPPHVARPEPQRHEDVIAFWTRRLVAAAPSTMPTDRPRRAARDYRGARLTFRLSKEVSGRLAGLANAHGTTQFVAIATCIAALFAARWARNDLVLLTDVSTRRTLAELDAVDLFVNFLPLRIETPAEASLEALLADARTATLDAIDHADLAYDELAPALVARIGAKVETFDRIVLTMAEAPLGSDWLPGVTTREIALDQEEFRLDADLELYWSPDGEGLRCTIDYAADLFDADTMATFARDLMRLIDLAVEDPRRTIQQLAGGLASDRPADVIFLDPPVEAGFMANRGLAGGLGVREAGASSDERDVLLPSLDLFTAAAVARRAGYHAAIYDLCADVDDMPSFEAAMERTAHPFVVALVALATIRVDCEVLCALRTRHPGMRLVLLTAIDHDPILRRALQATGADLALSFEGIVDLPGILLGAETANTVRLGPDGSLLRSPKRPLADLDRLPAPDWSLLRNKGYAYTLKTFPRTQFVPLRSAVGCPFSCGYYCPYPLTQGTKIRAHSQGWVLERLAEIAATGFCGVVFQDPVFTISRRRTEALCHAMIARGLTLKWTCETRIDCLDDALIALMAKAGCVGIEVGVESGNRDVMARQGKPGLTPEAVTRFADAVARHGIEATFLFILGLPEETKATIADTFRLIETSGIDPTQLNFSVITPYPGTRLFVEALERGWIARDWDSFSNFEPVMRTDNLSMADLADAQRFASEFVALLGTGDRGRKTTTETFYARLGAWAAGAEV